ncbi:MAG: hypothetical protein LW832_09190 [Parachlamydia sp.]|jgi:hypothetical protein|nr:hypothetical protein [Parachlamydia sp.]
MLNLLMPDPSSLFKPIGSWGLAAIAGGTYGYIARSISPNDGIYPAHYALWFIVAYRIKETLDEWEDHFNAYLGDSTPAINWTEADSKERFRLLYWKVLERKSEVVKATDWVFGFLFGLRPFEEVTEANVSQSSFLEMCRYRTWNVFKLTIKDHISILSSHRIMQLAGFALPAHTRVPFFLTAEILVKNILLVPFLYRYLNVCDRMAAGLELEAATALAERAQWIRSWLPKL